ncbi:unnamed protein product [Lactuca saligna]|uniref:Uncharacterized protein n=1 Tax=Lactuca saligna TaxID=75948 RepID=A0AA35YUI8_LACSI|nr:unnamed protein product [Lactuca saligna]
METRVLLGEQNLVPQGMVFSDTSRMVNDPTIKIINPQICKDLSKIEGYCIPGDEIDELVLDAGGKRVVWDRHNKLMLPMLFVRINVLVSTEASGYMTTYELTKKNQQEAHDRLVRQVSNLELEVTNLRASDRCKLRKEKYGFQISEHEMPSGHSEELQHALVAFSNEDYVASSGLDQSIFEAFKAFLIEEEE